MTDPFWSSEEYDERAHDLYNEGDYDGALETLKEGLALYPNAVELYVGLGHARLAREEFAWARLAFERALVLDPGHEDAMVGMGEVLLRLGRREEGRDLFSSVLALGYEDDVELVLSMGRAYFREGMYAEAKDLFTRLAASRPDAADAVASIGYALHGLGDEVEACRHLRRALRLEPDLNEARAYLGHLLYDRGDREGALREFERIPPTEHWDALAVWRVLEMKRSAGDPESALQPWAARLDELETPLSDPVEQLLAEVEASVSGSWSGIEYDENQLELFEGRRADRGDARLVHVRLPDGHVARGTCGEVVLQFRDALGFSHEAPGAFMRRMAERWHEQYGVEVPFTDPEAFVHSAGELGLIRVSDV